MVDIIAPKPIDLIVDDNKKMDQEFMLWTQDVTSQVNFNTIIDGSGSPETVVSAPANKRYRDTAGPNLYWKSVDDVAGDETKGWLLVI